MIYLASPYTTPDPAKKYARMRLVEEAVYFYTKMHERVFSPLVYTRGMIDCPDDFEWWKAWNRGWFERCDMLWVLELPGWEESLGVQCEIQWAEDKKRRGEFLTLPIDPEELAKECFQFGECLNSFRGVL